MLDSYRHKGLRNKLIGDLRSKGGIDENVLEVMNKIPRHLYIEDNTFLESAYEDKPFPIGAGQTISQPYTVAFQTTLLKVKKGERVLEIGTGSGYQTAVLCELGAKVWTIERQRTLFDNTKRRLLKLGYRAELRYGDGYKGILAFAPFDKILVTCGAPEVPNALLDQLKVGGILVLPVGGLDKQTMLVVERQDKDEYTYKEHGEFRFVPMLSDKENSS